MADKFGRVPVITLSALMCGVGFLGLPFARSYPSFMFFMSLWGCGAALKTPALTAFTMDVAPAGNKGIALTLPKTIGDSMFLVGPVAMGLIDDRLQNGMQAPSLVITSLLTFVCTSIFARTVHERPRTSSATHVELEVDHQLEEKL